MEKTATQLIRQAFSIREPQKGTLKKINDRCVLTGEKLKYGYSVFDIVAKSQGDWLETFKGDPYGFISESAASCWGASNPRYSMICSKSLAVIDGVGYEPLQSQKSAKEKDRISWRELIFFMCENLGETCVVVYSDDTKKRVWPKFADRLVGTIGSSTPILIYDTKQTGLYEIVRVNIVDLKNLILFVEDLYDKGFYKRNVLTSLYQNTKAMDTNNISDIASWESILRKKRGEKVFQFACLIARGKKKGEFI